VPPSDWDPFKKLEHRGWGEVAHRYRDSFERLTVQAIEPLLDAAKVGAGSRLLDVASGPGYVADAAARRGATAIAMDFAPAMARIARSSKPELAYAVGDAENLPVRTAALSAVTIAFGLLHFAAPDRAIAEAARVLTPGGRLAATVWDAPERARTFGLILEAVTAHGDLDVGLPPGPPFFQFSDPAVFRAALETAGFTDVQVRTVPLHWTILDSNTLLDLVMEGGVRTRALLKAQTPERLAAIRADLAERCRPYERSGLLELPTPCVLSSGSRR
jgi:SAM-dependent methyltransferase